MLPAEQKIAQLRAEGDFRPTVVAALYRRALHHLEFLLVESANAPGEWYLPQGGIEDETLEQAFYRELRAELGILSGELHQVEHDVHRARVVIASHQRDGYRLGKAYFVSAAEYNGSQDFTLQQEEIANAGWFGSEQFQRRIRSTNPEKISLMLRARDIVLGRHFP